MKTVKQVDIANELGLDVSIVNKILAKRRGAKFTKKTVDRVLSTAKRLGYDFEKPSKGKLLAALEEVFPADVSNSKLAKVRSFSIDRVEAFKRLIVRAGGAGIVLLILRAILGM